MEPGPVWIHGKVIEKNAAGITVEFPVSEFAGYKVGIPGDGQGSSVGDAIPVEGELLSIVDTRNTETELGSVTAHVKVAGVEFYVDPDQAKVEPIVAQAAGPEPDETTPPETAPENPPA